LELGLICRRSWRRITLGVDLWLRRSKNRGDIDARALSSLKVRNLETGEEVRNIGRAGC
jgi:hypothetical protein